MTDPGKQRFVDNFDYFAHQVGWYWHPADQHWYFYQPGQSVTPIEPPKDQLGGADKDFAFTMFSFMLGATFDQVQPAWGKLQLQNLGRNIVWEPRGAFRFLSATRTAVQPNTSLLEADITNCKRVFAEGGYTLEQERECIARAVTKDELSRAKRS